MNLSKLQLGALVVLGLLLLFVYVQLHRYHYVAITIEGGGFGGLMRVDSLTDKTCVVIVTNGQGNC